MAARMDVCTVSLITDSWSSLKGLAEAFRRGGASRISSAEEAASEMASSWSDAEETDISSSFSSSPWRAVAGGGLCELVLRDLARDSADFARLETRPVAFRLGLMAV